MKTKTIQFTALAVMSVALISCGGSTKANEASLKVSERLAFQTTTSLSTMSNLMDNASSMNLSMKHYKKLELPDEKKAKVEELLPTIDLMLSNDKNFDTVIEASDKEGYTHKQTISLLTPNNQTVSYTLYYSLGSEDLANNDVTDLPKDPIEGEETSPSEGENETLPTMLKADDEEEEESDQDADVKEEETKEDDEEDDEEEDDDEFDRKGEEKTTITTFDGIAILDDEVYNFSAKSTEEVEDDETEKKFALRMFNDVNGSYIDVIHSIEQEENEIEEEYEYILYEDDKVIDSFSIETEVEGSVNPLKEVEVKIGNDEYKFEQIVTENSVRYEVEYENKDEEYDELIYERIVETLEDGTINVSFVIVE